MLNLILWNKPPEIYPLWKINQKKAWGKPDELKRTDVSLCSLLLKRNGRNEKCSDSLRWFGVLWNVWNQKRNSSGTVWIMLHILRVNHDGAEDLFEQMKWIKVKMKIFDRKWHSAVCLYSSLRSLLFLPTVREIWVSVS